MINQSALVRPVVLGLALVGATFGANVIAGEAESTTAVEARLHADVGYLASDELEGRGIETKGIEKAADFIREKFKAAGLKSATADGLFFQPFSVRVKVNVDSDATRIVLKGPEGQEIKLAADKEFQPLAVGGDGKFDAPLVFAGYGITAKEYGYDDYAGIDVADKVVVILRREPQQANEKSIFEGTKTTKYSSIDSKLQNAWAHQAAAVLLVSDTFSTKTPADDKLVTANYLGSDSPVGMPIAHVKQETINALLAGTPIESIAKAEEWIDKDMMPLSTPLPGWRASGEFKFNRVNANLVNVAAVIEGEGPHADETIVIGAHYDHLGYGGQGSLSGATDQIHNGADDNASGTAALIELARRFAARNTKPARRLVFIAFSGEERGLLGSKHYVVRYPLYPLANTIAMLNFDMVGRMKDRTLTVYGTQTAKEFEPIVDALGKSHQLKIKKVADGAGPSDHASFYYEKVPVLHFFTGTHKDYHRPSDDIELVNVEGIRLSVNYAEEMIDAILEAPQRFAYVKVKSSDPHAGMDLPAGEMAYLGTIPDYSDETEGLLVTNTREGSPAEKGGIKPGDIIIDIAGMPIKNARGLAFALRKHKPGEKATFTVLRGPEKKQVTLEITFTSRPKSN